MAEYRFLFQASTAFPIAIFAMSLVLIGCLPYRFPTSCFIEPEAACEDAAACRRNEALSHWLYQIVPRHRCQIRPLDLGHWLAWAAFGNDDDGIFGEEHAAHFKPNMRPSLAKALAWGWRNPLHNFCFYVIGSADRVNDELTLLRLTPYYQEAFVYRPKASTNFAGKQSSLFLALHGGKPFLSTRLVWTPRYETRFYIGWRSRGNFGIRFNPLGHRKPLKHS